ncbi:MAG: lipid-A-disaccharide synthase, partial [Phototrophicales bacterium]
KNVISLQMQIAISAGDPSGDEHGAKIVRAIKSANPNAIIFGMGGSALRNAGVETCIDSEAEASVMGITDVASSFNKLYKAYKKLVYGLKTRKPDVLLLI